MKRLNILVSTLVVLTPVAARAHPPGTHIIHSHRSGRMLIVAFERIRRQAIAERAAQCIGARNTMADLSFRVSDRMTAVTDRVRTS